MDTNSSVKFFDCLVSNSCLKGYVELNNTVCPINIIDNNSTNPIINLSVIPRLAMFDQLLHKNSSKPVSCYDSIPTQSSFISSTQSLLLLVEQLEEIGWKSIRLDESIDNKYLVILSYECYDRSDRLHQLKFLIPHSWPNEKPKYIADLPNEFDCSWIIKQTRLIHVIESFQQTIDLYQDLWNQLDQIDSEYIVLDAQQQETNKTSKFSICYRKIMITPNINIFVQINPFIPNGFPVMKLNGPTSLIQNLDIKLQLNRSKWTESYGIPTNIEEILDLTLPRKDNLLLFGLSQTTEVECGICLSNIHVDNSRIVYCENVACLKQYHYDCLKSWFRKGRSTNQKGQQQQYQLHGILANQKDSLIKNGPCIYCKMNIVCK
ncbi:unnamed protein product [Didymodactylos carnosus]|uniref:RING-type domain-containing protein n=1 Tax=Didymodactylos carnosus TaxID=1234261 RepID=A0A814EH16_9BILA|nr:unnamed protein product [Didymodactylos carnosus]CAF0969224.1 unnamed protein product [Didymodactylos carnosus]CAF3565897.1 unnamed protein product [Didymodactylos carnosus]CAF3742399.1 unnamed protein product [Didymodactylos carnosus]